MNNGTQFELKSISSSIKHSPENSLFIGAGACDAKYVGVNSELMENIYLTSDPKSTINKSICAKLDENGNPLTFPHTSTHFSMLANLLCSRGEQEGNLLHIKVSNRKNDEKNFVGNVNNALRKIEKRGFLFFNFSFFFIIFFLFHKFFLIFFLFGLGEKAIGISGVIHIPNGRIHAHIMPDFPRRDLLSPTEVNNWLKFIDFDAPVTCLSVFITDDFDKLGLRLEHTHFFSTKQTNVGGHYHYDLSPETTYDAYFQICEKVFRIEPALIPENK